MKKEIKIGLIGNPNTGKTSLLNALSGLSLHVGNWSGKTVCKQEAEFCTKDCKVKLVDLPGLYCLTPYSKEEKVSQKFLGDDVDVIIQTIDVNSLERNLFLTFELLGLGKKLILAFNFNREAKKKGFKIDVDKIRKKLELPIIEIEADTGENKEALICEVKRLACSRYKKPSYVKNILKNDFEISHKATMAFIQKNIIPFYKVPLKKTRLEKLDYTLLNKYLALPFFFLVMFLVFVITFYLSSPFIEIFNNIFHYLGELINNSSINPVMKSFIVDGIINGVGSVISFVPLIFIMFFLISVLEDSGYMARIVIISDKIFSKIGLSGQSFIPMILGFGCNVPAIMATRTIRNRKERLIAIFINSFITCSARLPVYALFASVFFPSRAVFVIMLFYVLGVFFAFLASLVLSRLIKTEEESTLILELPPYRLPKLNNTIKYAWFQAKGFVKKAGTIILVAVIFIWFLAKLPWGVEYASEGSILGSIGKFISPIFAPLGFGHWSFSIALLLGVVGKEIIIGTLGSIHGENLSVILPQYISPVGAFSFLLFVLLYIPCLATVATIKKETESWKYTLIHLFSVSGFAWIVSFLFYQFMIK